MGSACCVASRDRTITTRSTNDVIPRNIRYSPSWSVRWDNRRRVAGEEASINWNSDGVGTNDRLDNKSQTTVGTAYASEEGSPLESFRNLTWQKSSPSEGFTPQPDQSVSQITTEVKRSSETHLASRSSPTMMMSSSTHSVSSFSASPLSSSQPHFLPPSRWPPRCQLSDTRIPTIKSPNFSISEESSPLTLPACSHRGSYGGSSDSYSSFSPSNDTPTCGVCLKPLTEKSSWGGHKIINNNELAVVSVLICGHVYHAECLENMTSEINKYDPACPVCTFGEKKVYKLSEKALKADVESRARINKKSRSRVVDGEMNGEDFVFSGSPKMRLSSSVKGLVGKPFLKRPFSFGLKGSRSLSENNVSWKKGFFWAKSSKE